MLQGKRIAVTMPAYFAEKTVAKTYGDIDHELVDHVILVDDCSKDRTLEVSKELGIDAHRNESNLNYGGNVKRCLRLALDGGADVVVLLHPDYQYTPKLIPALSSMLTTGFYGVALASRTSGGGALSGGMPVWRYLANWGLTNVMDVAFGTHHTEYHTGYRAYSRELLEAVDFESLANDFSFDNDLFTAALRAGFKTCEVTCPTSYEEDASSIPFDKAVRYGFQCLKLAGSQLVWRLSGRPGWVDRYSD